MKTCHIIYGLANGGIETMLVNIMNEQVKTENICIVIINNMINGGLLAKIDKRVQVFLLNRKLKSRNPFFLIKLNYLLWRLKPNIIHCHFPQLIDYILPVFRKKTILTRHSTHSGFAIPFFPKYKKTYSISKSVQQELQTFGVSSELVYNGIDTSSIKVKTDIKKNSVFRIIQIGRLDISHKGQHLLIEAIEQIVRKHNITDIRVDFTGTGKSYSALNEMIKQKKLNDYITLLGDVQHKYLEEHICDYDLLVQPSLFEGFGLTVVEGVLAGVPVLVSDIEGPMEIINNGRFGYFFNTGNVENLIEKILQIVNEKNTEKQNQLTEKARQYALAHFDVKITAKSYLTKYQEFV
jgi:glycosyltransferase involved in cell wall biosynthesis